MESVIQRSIRTRIVYDIGQKIIFYAQRLGLSILISQILGQIKRVKKCLENKPSINHLPLWMSLWLSHAP